MRTFDVAAIEEVVSRALSWCRGVPMLTGGGPANGNMLTMGNEEMVGGAITTRTPQHQVPVGRPIAA